MSGTLLTLTPLRVGGALAGGGDPLVRRAVADPGGDAAVEVQGGAVLGEAGQSGFGDLAAHGVAHRVQHGAFVRRHVHGHVVRVECRPCPGPCPQPISVVSTGQEQVAVVARRQQVAEQDADRPVLRGDDGRPEVVGVVHAEGLAPSIGASAPTGRIEVRVGQRHAGCRARRWWRAGRSRAAAWPAGRGGTSCGTGRPPIS